MKKLSLIFIIVFIILPKINAQQPISRDRSGISINTINSDFALAVAWSSTGATNAKVIATILSSNSVYKQSNPYTSFTTKPLIVFLSVNSIFSYASSDLRTKIKGNIIFLNRMTVNYNLQNAFLNFKEQTIQNFTLQKKQQVEEHTGSFKKNKLYNNTNYLII